VKQLAELWGFSERTIRRLIEDEPEVVMIHKGSRHKRTYRRVQIPASVAERIHRKLTVRQQ
jgi:predicted transcriptional regulator